MVNNQEEFEFFKHTGVKGMKWGVRRKSDSTKSKNNKPLNKFAETIAIQKAINKAQVEVVKDIRNGAKKEWSKTKGKSILKRVNSIKWDSDIRRSIIMVSNKDYDNYNKQVSDKAKVTLKDVIKAHNKIINMDNLNHFMNTTYMNDLNFQQESLNNHLNNSFMNNMHGVY